MEEDAISLPRARAALSKTRERAAASTSKRHQARQIQINSESLSEALLALPESVGSPGVREILLMKMDATTHGDDYTQKTTLGFVKPESEGLVVEENTCSAPSAMQPKHTAA